MRFIDIDVFRYIVGSFDTFIFVRNFVIYAILESIS